MGNVLLDFRQIVRIGDCGLLRIHRIWLTNYFHRHDVMSIVMEIHVLMSK
jgi:hypothetical protein